MKSTRSHGTVAALVALGLIATACGGDDDATDSTDNTETTASPGGQSSEDSGSSDDAGLGDDSVVIALASDPGTLHPYLTTSEPAFQLLEFVYDNLVKLDDEGNVLPNLAESWTYEGEVATFTIRDGATCSDGTAVTPSVLASNLEWIQEPANASAQIDLTFGGDAGFAVAADDEAGTLTITLPQPTDYFLETTASLLPMACGNWQDDPDQLSAAPIGSGPYTLEAAVPGDRYELQRNDAYAWGPLDTDIADMPAEIEIRIIGNETTLANLIESGEVHVGVVNGPDRERFSGDSYGAVVTPIGNQFSFFNQTEGRITSDERVRRALIHAVDLGAIAPIAAQGLSDERSTSMLEGQPVYCGTNPNAVELLPEYDPEQAAALLDEAGWVVGDDGIRTKDGQRLTLDAPYQITTSGSERGAELFAEAWREIGVDAQLRGVTEGERSEIFFGTGQFDVFPLLSARPPSPAPWVGLFTGDNTAGVVNEVFNEKGPEALASSDHDAACEAWLAAEDALYSTVTYVPVSVEVLNWITNDVTFRTNGSHIIPMSLQSAD